MNFFTFLIKNKEKEMEQGGYMQRLIRMSRKEAIHRFPVGTGGKTSLRKHVSLFLPRSQPKLRQRPAP